MKSQGDVKTNNKGEGGQSADDERYVTIYLLSSSSLSSFCSKDENAVNIFSQ